jgi:hypothetical protein
VDGVISFEVVGLVCALLGAVLVTARSSRVRAAGFGAWVIGNAAWALYAASAGAVLLQVQFVAFLFLAMLGLLNNVK